MLNTAKHFKKLRPKLLIQSRPNYFSAGIFYMGDLNKFFVFESPVSGSSVVKRKEAVPTE